MKDFVRFLVGFVCLFIALYACSGGSGTNEEPEYIPVEEVTLSQRTLTMAVGEELTLKVQVVPANATDKKVSWSSSRTSVATVSANGVVTAVAEGETEITASVGGKKGKCVVTVKNGIVAVESVSLSDEALTLEEGATATLVATILPDNATDKSVTWTSSDASVAIVSSEGVVTAVKEGSATIIAAAGGKEATCIVTVKKQVVSVTEIILSETSLTLDEGKSATLTATVLPDNAADKSVTWSSSDPAVATVSSEGLVTAVKEGSATITASAGGKEATCAVTVKKQVISVTSVTLSETSLTLDEGKSVTLTATVLPANATDKSVIWTSSDASIATVSITGVVTAVKEGSATITASAGGKEATCTVTVKKSIVSVTGITLSETSLTLDEGKSATLTATVLPANTTDKSVTWSSSDPAVATVSSTGVVTAVKEGSATITAAAGGKQATCAVTVKKQFVPVTGITLSETSLTLDEGKSATLTATVLPANATDKSVIWTSSDASIATVSITGVVTAVKEGSAMITASAGGKEATCTVTVKKSIVSVTGITLSETSLTLDEGKSATLTATVQPANATDKSVTWSSSDPVVATVSSTGVVTALKEGSATITASAGGKQATCAVTVKKQVVSVTGITLSATSLTLDEGKSATLSATVQPANATNKNVTWTSSDPAVATVSSTGVVTAVKEGSATITAAAGGKQATCVVTVKKQIVSVTSVTLSETSLTLDEGKSATLTATVLPANATDKSVIWTSSDASIATVSITGVVTALKEGSATITASAGGKQATCVVTVKRQVISVTSVTLSETSLILDEGKSATLTATVLPANATDKSVIWTSSDASIATVSITGVVTAVKEGSATITASAGDKHATCAVTVKKPVISVTGVTLSATSLTLDEGKSATLTATVLPANATDKSVTWSSSDPAVATVSSTGVVTGVKEGSATITASAGGKQATCAITVKKQVVSVTNITLSATSLTLDEGKSATLTATVLPANATDKSVTWSSSDPAVATVSSTGVVTGVKEGSATITASAGGKQATCAVTVKKPVISVTGVTLSATSLTLDEGKSATLTATVLPANATDKSVTWSSSDPAVATVSSTGVVTGVKEGSATITASAGGKHATCVVTVKKPVISVTGVTLSATSLTLDEGKSATLTATVLPANATDKSVTWSSSDPAVATVSSTGVVTGVKEGSATITASAGGKHATCVVTVKKPVISVTGVTLSATSLTLDEGKSATLTATVLPANATDKSVTWSSSDPAVATVSSTGVVTAVKEGSATITASAGGKRAICVVTVKAKQESGIGSEINPWEDDDEDYGGTVN